MLSGKPKATKKPAKRKAAKLEEPSKKKSKKSAKAALGHLVVCLSGKLSQSRSDFQAYINDNGGQCKNSVTKAVTHLVTTSEELFACTSKVIKAQSYGIPIVSEVSPSMSAAFPVQMGYHSFWYTH